MVDVTIHSLQSTIERCKGFMSIIFFALKSQKKEFDIWEEEKWKGEWQKDNYRITMPTLFSYFLSETKEEEYWRRTDKQTQWTEHNMATTLQDAAHT